MKNRRCFQVFVALALSRLSFCGETDATMIRPLRWPARQGVPAAADVEMRSYMEDLSYEARAAYCRAGEKWG